MTQELESITAVVSASAQEGVIMVTGTPEQLAEIADSHTGRYLKDMLAPRRVAAE